MKSVISSHEAPKEEVLKRVKGVILCGDMYEFVKIGSVKIFVYILGDYKYNITYINNSVLTFELDNVYCFKF